MFYFIVNKFTLLNYKFEFVQNPANIQLGKFYYNSIFHSEFYGGKNMQEVKLMDLGL